MKNSYQLYPKLKINGEWRIIEEIYIAPLGHLMIKFYDEERKTFHTTNVGLWEEVLVPMMENKMDVSIKDKLYPELSMEQAKELVGYDDKKEMEASDSFLNILEKK